MAKTNNTKQAFWVALGSLFSFGFGLVSSIILSRYFEKADYGTYRQVIYIYGSLLTIFTLGLPKAYSFFLPRTEDAQARDVIKKITNLFFLLGGVFSISLYLASDAIALFLRNEDLALALKIFSPVPFFLLPTIGLEGILATYRMTRFVAIYTVVTRVAMLSCVVLPVLIWDAGYKGALTGFTIASFVTFLTALYFKYMPVRSYGRDKSDLKYQEIFGFSLPLLYASLWGMLISSTDQFFISRYFGQEVFADFSNGSLELPFVGMIVGATAAVLSPIFSRMSHEQLDPKKEIFPIWKSVFEKSALLIYPLLLYVWFFADVLMIFLYGEQYAESAIYFRIKAITNFFAIIVYAPLLINSGKVKYYANVHCFIAILVVFLEYISVKTINSPYAISGISLICQIIKTALLLYAAAKILEVKFHQLFPFSLLVKILIPSSLALMAIKYSLDQFILSEFLILIIGGLLFAIFYTLLTFVFRLDYLGLLKPLFARVAKKAN